MPMKKIIIIVLVLLALLCGALYINSYELKEIKVSGCEIVDEQQVIDAVKAKANNTLFLYLSNKIKHNDTIR